MILRWGSIILFALVFVIIIGSIYMIEKKKELRHQDIDKKTAKLISLGKMTEDSKELNLDDCAICLEELKEIQNIHIT